MRNRAENPYRSTWYVSDVGYELAKELLIPTEEGLTLEAPSPYERRFWDDEVELGEHQVLWMVINANPSECDQIEHLSLTYDPMIVPALHRSFSRIEIEADSIIAFANEYGFLGRATAKLIPWDERMEATSDFSYGELLEDWGTRILKMRTLIEIWDCYRNPSQASQAKLREILEMDDNKIYVRTNYLEEQIPFGEDLAQPIIDWDWDHLEADLDDLPPVVDPSVRLRLGARLLLQEAVNDELRDGTHALIEVKDGSPIHLSPADLLGALYIHFAQELVGRSVPAKQCPACRSYFIPEHGKQIYCDEKCKFKGYRQRKKSKGEGISG